LAREKPIPSRRLQCHLAYIKSWKGYLHDRQEVSNSIAVRGSEHKQPCESPDLEIECISEVIGDVEGLGDGVRAVFLDACYYEGGFFFVEEGHAPGGLEGEFGKVDDEEVPDYAGDAG
jgi:hypothetical protein